ncbi:hypothetical protein ZEAMMB73_Zm00001d025701 [Zea mays]|uniref:Uncharacterized protein n=1 Tax=Zea mays TaxID=4577 RepID=A0A1D6J8P2_MAIZE|nr:hypothetical protein ZEAMMB73_Zm00001d025701 [Zea mays]
MSHPVQMKWQEPFQIRMEAIIIYLEALFMFSEVMLLMIDSFISLLQVYDMSDSQMKLNDFISSPVVEDGQDEFEKGDFIVDDEEEVEGEEEEQKSDDEK